MNLQRVAPAATLTAVALLAIGALTLRSAPSQILDAQRTPLDCLVCGDVGGADVLLNVALFVPLGIGLAGLRRSLPFTIAAAFLLSFSIELLQYTVIVGRDVDGSAFPLFGEAIVLGRERGDILFPEDGYVSGTHARIALRDEHVFLTDLGSSNGTFLRLRHERTVPAGSYMLMGQQLFRLEYR